LTALNLLRSRWSSLRVSEKKTALETISNCHTSPKTFQNIKNAIRIGFELNQTERKKVFHEILKSKGTKRKTKTSSDQEWSSDDLQLKLSLKEEYDSNSLISSTRSIIGGVKDPISSKDFYFLQKAKTEESIRLLNLIESSLYKTLTKSSQDDIMDRYMKTLELEKIYVSSSSPPTGSSRSSDNSSPFISAKTY
jgi:hypothetical protein